MLLLYPRLDGFFSSFVKLQTIVARADDDTHRFDTVKLLGKEATPVKTLAHSDMDVQGASAAFRLNLPDLLSLFEFSYLGHYSGPSHTGAHLAVGLVQLSLGYPLQVSNGDFHQLNAMNDVAGAAVMGV